MRFALIIAALSTIFASAFVAKRTSDANVQAHEQFAEAKLLQLVEERLQQPITIEFEQPVSLDRWLAEFTSQTGIAAEIRQESRNVESPTVQLSLTNQPARSVLNRLCDQTYSTWRPEPTGNVAIYLSDLRAPFTIEQHPLRPSFSQEQQRQIAGALRTILDRDFLYKTGKFGDLVLVQDGVVIAQQYQEQLATRELLDKLQTAMEQAGALPKQGLSPTDPRLAPIVLTTRPFISENLRTALKQQVTCNFDQVRLRVCLADFTEQTGVSFLLPEQLEGEVPGDWPITFQLKNPLSLQSALSLILEPCGLTYAPTPDEKVLKIVPIEQTPGVWRAYPIPDLPKAPQPGAPDPTRRLLASAMAGTWLELDESKTLHRLGDVMLVNQPELQHERVENALQALRTVQSGAATWSDAASFARIPSKSWEHYDLAVFDVRPLTQAGFTAQEIAALAAFPEHIEYFGAVKEFNGLLVIRGRPVGLPHVREVLEVLTELHQRRRPRSTGNLLTRVNQDRATNDPVSVMYVVDDLLEPAGALSLDELQAMIRTTISLEKDGVSSWIDVRMNRFLVGRVHPGYVEPLEAKLQELRAEPAAAR